MKIYNTFIIGLMTVAGLASCVSEDIKSNLDKTATGRMALDVSLLEPQSLTRAQEEALDFPVEVVSEDGTYSVTYESVEDVPASVVLPVGNYTVTSHTAGKCLKKRTAPYYEGTSPMEILNQTTTNVEVVCKMKNSHIQVNYNDEFLSLFDSWTVTINDGGETALDFSSNSNRKEYYWLFENEVESLTLNFSGVLKSDGSTINAQSALTKSMVDERYDDDTKYFRGGDELIVNFGVLPADPKTGKITTVTINASVVFTETGDEMKVDVTDTENTQGSGQNDPNPQDPQTGDDNAIAITLPAPVTLSAAESATADPTSGDVIMNATKGLKSVMVKVESSSDEMMEQLAAVAKGYEGVDLVNGCEVVGNQNLVAFLGSLGKEITVPAEGDTDYTFPVGQFYLFLGLLPGTHNFIMTVTDMEGNQKSGTLQVTITE